jgi:hypothetical protein
LIVKSEHRNTFQEQQNEKESIDRLKVVISEKINELNSTKNVIKQQVLMRQIDKLVNKVAVLSFDYLEKYHEGVIK